ncbi:hypothetical protein QI30_06220 [Kurthia sp. 3B1D]|uniref:DUF4440 domain-containing protein n=1 Tax=Candidatus Kurthia intestinigallinarum TaxID=1562256 RepID=A0A433RV97_9BACL|nr:DUF4440 domain-containing protein [Kurthia sp. 3B1D]RUS57179.1 hypothetical protein QI30_06220 [Kurthia sp. 3B1D]
MHDTILALELALLKPEVRRSSKALRLFLADDFFEIGSSGKVLYQQEQIEEIVLGDVCMTIDNFHIKLLSEDIILATYRVYNAVNAQHSLRSSIWKRVDGQWKMHFHQGTLTNA